MKLLKMLTLLALVLFPFGELLRFEMVNHIVIKPLDVVVGLAALVFLFEKRYQISSIKYKVLLPIILFPLIGLFSLFINLTWLKSSEFFVALLYLIRWLAYATLWPLVLSFDKQFKKKIVFFLFIDGLSIVVAGFVQYFFFNSLKSWYYLGWDDHMHRVFSTFLDPNFTGAFLVLFFLFLGGTIQFHIQKKQYKESKILSILLFFTLMAIFLTFSRAALLMLMAGSIIFLLLIRQKKLILLLLAVLLLFIVVASPKFYDENMNLFRGASSKARLENDAVALRIIQDRPLVGVGFDSYRYTKRLYGLNHDWTKAPSHADAGVENSWLFVLATTGIIGFAAYGWLWLVILKKAHGLYRKKAHIIAIVVISSSIGLFVNGLFLNSLFFPSLMMWMWLLIGLSSSEL